MTIKTLPNLDLYMPLRFEIQLRGNVDVNRSPMNGVMTTVEMPGDQWSFRMEYGGKDNLEYAALRAFWNSFRGQAHTLRCWNIANPEPRGTLRGSPSLSAGAVEGANVVIVAGTAGTTLLPGDFLGITLNNATTQLVEVYSSTGTGTITATIHPPLRRAANVGAAVIWDRPTADFLLTSAPFIPHEAFASGNFSIEAIEFVT